MAKRKKEEVVKVEPASGTIFYNKRGSQLLDDVEFCCAKKVVSVKEHYFIKQCTSGIDQGSFFNPVSPYYQDGMEELTVKSKGRDMYEFRKVPKEVFELYIKFLQTRNIAYLKNAERQLI